MQEKKESVVVSAGSGAASVCSFGDDENEVEGAKIGMKTGSGEIERARLKLCGDHNGFGELEMGSMLETEQQYPGWV